jgi:hypothetical protein
VDVRGGDYRLRGQPWRFAQRADGSALRCGSCLLRGDGDAAGPHRRLLRRPRLYYSEGFGHVAAHLATLDISSFNAKAPPPKTPAFWTIVEINRTPEDTELADRIDALGNPDVLTVQLLIDYNRDSPLSNVLKERKNRRAIPHWLERQGYVSVRNPNAADGVWKIEGVRYVIYAKATLSPAEQFRRVNEYVRNPPMYAGPDDDEDEGS